MSNILLLELDKFSKQVSWDLEDSMKQPLIKLRENIVEGNQQTAKRCFFVIIFVLLSTEMSVVKKL